MANHQILMALLLFICFDINGQIYYKKNKH
jgi:hypothetical protein